MYKQISFLFLIGTALAQKEATEKNAQHTTVSVTQAPGTGENCTTFGGEPGTCVSYHSCPDTYDIDTPGLIDYHFEVAYPCASYEDFCCKIPATPKPLEDQREGCGWRKPGGVGLNINGSDSETAYGEFPWVVAIFDIDDKQQYIGSGSLIDRRVVLTTAHHVVKAKKLRVRAGEWDTQTDKELYPHQDRDVESFVVHKDFNKVLFYDVAVLFLSKPVDPAPNIGIACLPPPKQLAEPDTKCFVTGWGKQNFGRPDIYQVILRKEELSVVQHSDCRNQLRKTRLGNKFELHHTFMCANKKSRESCVGDGGSPLVCPVGSEEDRYVQNGMAAWSVGCSDSPSVFVDVAVLRDWIDNEVLGYGIENLEYAKY